MPGAPSGQVLDLLAAGDSRSDDRRVGGRGLYGRGQAPVAQRHRDVVVLLLEAEGARHAATAGAYLADLVSRPRERRHRRRRADERLLVAVAVEERAPRPRLESQLESAGPLTQQEFLQQQ